MRLINFFNLPCGNKTFVLSGPALGPVLGSVLGSSGGPAFLQPPIIETAVGPPAKSFPLHLVHAGRCCLDAVTSALTLTPVKMLHPQRRLFTMFMTRPSSLLQQE